MDRKGSSASLRCCSFNDLRYVERISFRLSFFCYTVVYFFFFSFFFSFDGKRKAIERAGLELNHSSNVSVFYSMFSSCSSVMCVWCGASREGVILSIAIVSILLLPYPRRCSIYMLLPLPFVLWLDSNSRIITQPNTAWEISHSKALYTVLYL